MLSCKPLNQFVDPNTVHCIWIRIQDFGPILIRIQGYVINFEKNVYKKDLFKKILQQEHNGTERNLVSWLFEW